MGVYVLDTNVLLRLVNSADGQHQLVVDCVDTLVSAGDECVLAPQTLIEMWVVATRPTDVNGLGWSAPYTQTMIDSLLKRFALVQETDQLFPTWLQLVSTENIVGKRTHDARIAALMICANIEQIVTLNPRDFRNMPDVTPVHPNQIVSSS